MRFSGLHAALGGTALCLLMGLSPLAAAHAADRSRTITVSGEGEARAVPDQAQLSAGVSTIAVTADAALTQNARKMTTVFDALKRLGVSERAIQTSNFSVQPQYAPNSAGNLESITGYQVSNQVNVQLDDTKRLGPALDALVAAGANQINSVSFSIRDTAALLTAARVAAVADALKRAQTYTGAAGVGVGGVISIQENGTEAPMPMFRVISAARHADSTPTAAGDMSVTANVTVTFEIK